MKIKFNDEYRIISDVNGYTVQKYRGLDKENQERWEGITYHGHFDQAYVRLAQLRVRLIDADNLKDAIKAATTIGTEMTAILKEAHMGE